MAPLAPEELRPKLVELYVEQKLTCAQAHAELQRQGLKLSYRYVTKCIKQLGLMRTVSEQHILSGIAKRLRWQRTCEICQRQFESTTKRGRWCSDCVPKKEQTNEESRLWSGYAKKFGMSKAQYDAMLEKQDNKCAVCKKSFDDMPTSHVHVDHDHLTGKVRSVLCLYCNRGIGCFFDDPATLRAAALYLENHSANERPNMVP